EVGSRFPGLVSNVRGRGLMCAFDLPGTAGRDSLLSILREQEKLLLLPCGPRSIRFRPALTISTDELSTGLKGLDRALGRLGHTGATSAHCHTANKTNNPPSAVPRPA